MINEKSSAAKPALIFVVLFAVIITLGAIIYLAMFKKSLPTAVQPAKNPANYQNLVDDNNYLFLAKYQYANDNNKNLLSVFIYKPGTNQIIKSKNIDTVDPIPELENSSVQYNYLTKDIFYSTNGVGGIGPRTSSNCINKDDSCDFRIFKININDSKSIKLFEDKDGQPNQWVLNKTDNSLYLYYVGDILLIKKVDIDKGAAETVINQPNIPNRYFNKIQISQDGKELFASCNNTAPEDPKDINNAYLCSVDLINNKFTTSLISSEISSYNSMSLDRQYLGFYSNGLYIYDLQNKNLIKVPYNGGAEQNNLLWSKNSKRLFFSEEGNLKYYDVNTPIAISMKIFKNYLIPYLLSASNTNNYVLYRLSDNTALGIFDLSKNQDITKLPDIFSFSADYHYDSEWYQE